MARKAKSKPSPSITVTWRRTPLPASIFKPGMKVRFWTKDEMPANPLFGWPEDGSMDRLHGFKATITRVDRNALGHHRLVLTGVDNRWHISTDMVTPIAPSAAIRKLIAKAAKEAEAAAKTKEEKARAIMKKHRVGESTARLAKIIAGMTCNRLALADAFGIVAGVPGGGMRKLVSFYESERA